MLVSRQCIFFISDQKTFFVQKRFSCKYAFRVFFVFYTKSVFTRKTSFLFFTRKAFLHEKRLNPLNRPPEKNGGTVQFQQGGVRFEKVSGQGQLDRRIEGSVREGSKSYKRADVRIVPSRKVIADISRSRLEYSRLGAYLYQFNEGKTQIMVEETRG